MPITGDNPEHGTRVDLTRTDDAELTYTGRIATNDRSFSLRVTVAGDTVVAETDGGPDLAERARLIVRTALKHAAADGLPPPRRIQRWRDSRD
ncbi:MAG: hypothetical protein IPG50_02975 [Myxococcales bacterium]|nr:hypothetical protein [Myxococcales bacterium]